MEIVLIFLSKIFEWLIWIAGISSQAGKRIHSPGFERFSFILFLTLWISPLKLQMHVDHQSFATCKMRCLNLRDTNETPFLLKFELWFSMLFKYVRFLRMEKPENYDHFIPNCMLLTFDIQILKMQQECLRQ